MTLKITSFNTEIESVIKIKDSTTLLSNLGTIRLSKDTLVAWKQ